MTATLHQFGAEVVGFVEDWKGMGDFFLGYRGGGGLSSKRVFMKEIPFKINPHKKI